MTNDEIVQALKEFGSDFRKLRHGVVLAWGETMDDRSNSNIRRDDPRLVEPFRRSGEAAKAMLAWMQSGLLRDRWPWIEEGSTELAVYLKIIGETYGSGAFDEDSFVELETAFNHEADCFAKEFMNGLIDQIDPS